MCEAGIISDTLENKKKRQQAHTRSHTEEDWETGEVLTRKEGKLRT